MRQCCVGTWFVSACAAGWVPGSSPSWPDVPCCHESGGTHRKKKDFRFFGSGGVCKVGQEVLCLVTTYSHFAQQAGCVYIPGIASAQGSTP